MAQLSGYTTTGGSGGGGNTGSRSDDDNTKYWSLERKKRAYTDYLDSKTEEIDEQKDARRYRHASQWTAEQVKIFNKRKQPIVTYNRIGKKIDGVVGLIERLKQSPQAFPRTPHEEQGAALATAVIRAVLDSAEWKTKTYAVGQNAAIDGYGGIELLLEAGDQGDPDISFEVVENDGFFYDPRSIRLDFSDARYMGQGKWLDLDQAKEMFPEHAEDLQDAMESATDLSSNSDRDNKWFITDGFTKRIRIVEIWYLMGGEWCWGLFTGDMNLQEGKSWLHDEKGKTFCKYVMFSAQVDQDGDRYGFVRNLKSAQDEINQRRSKALHLLNTRRIIAEQGAFDDVEVTRREAARPDGVVIRNKGFEAEFDDGSKNQEIQAHLEFLVDAKAEIENFGPGNPLIGQDVGSDSSGKAIQLRQQAAMAELGPFFGSFRGWKIRIYRAVWNAVKEHWRTERYVRVTDDMNVVQWLGINQAGINPQTGMPAMVNQISNLDVDIILDEGPDAVTVGVETFEALQAIASNGTPIPPDILIELHPFLDPDTKKRMLEKLSAPNPEKQLQLQGAQAEIAKTASETKLNEAKVIDTLRGEQGGGEQQEHPLVTMANVENTQADTAHKKAQALKTMMEAQLAPQEVAHQQNMDRRTANRDDTQQALDQRNSDMDRAQSAYDSAADRDGQERDRQQAAYESERDKPANDPKFDLEREKIALERERMQMEREERQKDRELDQMTNTQKRGEGGKISLDGTLATQMNAHAQKNAESITGASKVMAEATKILAKAAESMAESSKVMADAVTKPKKIVRDKSGRVSHVETVR